MYFLASSFNLPINYYPGIPFYHQFCLLLTPNILHADPAVFFLRHALHVCSGVSLTGLVEQHPGNRAGRAAAGHFSGGDLSSHHEAPGLANHGAMMTTTVMVVIDMLHTILIYGIYMIVYMV